MKISDLNHLETISEAPKVVGGFSYGFSNGFLNRWFANLSIKEAVVSQSATPNGKGSAVSMTGELENGAHFAFASTSYVSSTSYISR